MNFASNYPIPQQQVTPVPDPMDYANSAKKILANAIPGLEPMSASASTNVGQLLNGLPSASPVQRSNAYFGTGSGMPGSDFVRNRGFDLYGEKAESYKQRGFDDFLQLLRGVSGTVAPTTGEQAQSQQFNQNLEQRQIENNQANQRFNANYKDPNAIDDKAWYSTDSGDVYNRSGQKIRNDPNFRINKRIGF